jgi:hypothetical protein
MGCELWEGGDERAFSASDLMTLLLEMEDRGNRVVYPALSEVMD